LLCGNSANQTCAITNIKFEHIIINDFNPILSMIEPTNGVDQAPIKNGRLTNNPANDKLQLNLC